MKITSADSPTVPPSSSADPEPSGASDKQSGRQSLVRSRSPELGNLQALGAGERSVRQRLFEHSSEAGPVAPSSSHSPLDVAAASSSHPQPSLRPDFHPELPLFGSDFEIVPDFINFFSQPGLSSQPDLSIEPGPSIWSSLLGARDEQGASSSTSAAGQMPTQTAYLADYSAGLSAPEPYAFAINQQREMRPPQMQQPQIAQAQQNFSATELRMVGTYLGGRQQPQAATPVRQQREVQQFQMLPPQASRRALDAVRGLDTMATADVVAARGRQIELERRATALENDPLTPLLGLLYENQSTDPFGRSVAVAMWSVHCKHILPASDELIAESAQMSVEQLNRYVTQQARLNISDPEVRNWFNGLNSYTRVGLNQIDAFIAEANR